MSYFRGAFLMGAISIAWPAFAGETSPVGQPDDWAWHKVSEHVLESAPGLHHEPTSAAVLGGRLAWAEYTADAVYIFDGSGKLEKTIGANDATGALARPRAIAWTPDALYEFGIGTRSLYVLKDPPRISHETHLEDPVCLIRSLGSRKLLLGFLSTGEDDEERLGVTDEDGAALKYFFRVHNPAPKGLMRSGNVLAADVDLANGLIFATTALDYRITAVDFSGKVVRTFGQPGPEYKPPQFIGTVHDGSEFASWETTFTPVRWLFVLSDVVAVGYVISGTETRFDLYKPTGEQVAAGIPLEGKPIAKGTGHTLYASFVKSDSQDNSVTIREYQLRQAKTVALRALTEYSAAFLSCKKFWPGPQLRLSVCPGHFDNGNVNQFTWDVGEAIVAALQQEIERVPVPSDLLARLLAVRSDDERDNELRIWLRSSPSFSRFVAERVAPRLSTTGIGCSDCGALAHADGTSRDAHGRSSDQVKP